MPHKEIEERQVYEIIDAFLTEAKDQHGNDRSLFRLNEDRHLAAERFMELLSSHRRALIQEIKEKVEGMNEKVPCDCPKGGLVGEEERPCDKCGGSQYAKKHICPFNDGENQCECFNSALSSLLSALKEME